jgi:hypothetical protein
MNLRYRQLDDNTRPEGFALYPLLQVFLRHDVNMRPALALVDSGSTDCIFPASLGEVLGIDVPSGRPFQFQSFNFDTTEGFVHKVNLQVTGFPHWIEIDVVFVRSEVMAILGQVGFFDHYQIVFERFKRQFEINTKVGAIIRNKRGHGRGRGRGR